MITTHKHGINNPSLAYNLIMQQKTLTSFASNHIWRNAQFPTAIRMFTTRRQYFSQDRELEMRKNINKYDDLVHQSAQNGQEFVKLPSERNNGGKTCGAEQHPA